MIEVTLQEGDRLDWALKSFKKKVEKSGLLQELRRRRHYVKPSVMRQLKSAAAQRRARSRDGEPSSASGWHWVRRRRACSHRWCAAGCCPSSWALRSGSWRR